MVKEKRPKKSALNCENMNLLSLPSETDASRKEKKWTECLKIKNEVRSTKK